VRSIDYIIIFLLFYTGTNIIYTHSQSKTDFISRSGYNDSVFTKNVKNYFQDIRQGSVSNINIYKFTGFSLFSIGAGVLLHNFQKHAWWSGEREKFHIENDWSYAMSMDKLGHVFIAGLINRTMKDAYQWSGMNNTTASWVGTLISIGYMTDIEIEDGFAKEWGYSPGDEIANITGDALSIAQDLWDPLKTVKLRWSYWPTHDPNHKGDFPDDYNGQTFWLSFSIHNYLSKKLQNIWPSYLDLAIGYGVKEYDNYGPNGRIQNLYLSLDYDIRKIIPGQSGFIKWFKELIWNFKFIPAPALKYNMTQGKVDFVVHW
jgi:hypothetical protein